MPTFKLATSVWHDSLLPRDACMINPVFHTINPAPDYDQLCTDWANAVNTCFNFQNNNKITVKAYNVRTHPHGPPLAEKTINPVGWTVAPIMREIALCLSFFAGTNTKWTRGRLYVPAFWVATPTSVVVRPSGAIRSSVGALAQKAADLGGVDVDWSVYSKTKDTNNAISDWWVDDEWDIQRRRGLRTTARTTGTVSE